MFVPDKPFQPRLLFVGKAGAYPIEEPFRCSTNIRLDLKGLPGTNTLAYYENSWLTGKKSFITWAPWKTPVIYGVNFTAISNYIYNFSFVLIMVNYIKLKRALKWLFVLLLFSTEFFDFNVWHLRDFIFSP